MPTGSASGPRSCGGADDQAARIQAALDAELDRSGWRATPTAAAAATYDRTLRIMVERERARFGAWYEMFPRSARGRARPARHLPRRRGAAALCRRDGLRRPLPAADPPDRPQLPQGAEQHPDRRARRPRQPLGHRRGRRAGTRPSTPSSARSTTSTAWSPRPRELGIEIALDIAFQCSPDHPYVREHPEWFRHRPDGTIKYAENPPKKYQDIYPIDFECDDWKALWDELATSSCSGSATA